MRTELILDEVERVDAERGEKTAETPDQGAFQRRTVHDVPTRVPRMFSQPAPSMLDGTYLRIDASKLAKIISYLLLDATYTLRAIRTIKIDKYY